MATSMKLHPVVSQEMHERIEALIDQLTSDTEEVRSAAVDALAAMGQPAESRLVAALVLRLNDPDLRLAEWAFNELLRIAPSDEAVLTGHLSLLHHPKARARSLG